MLYEGISECKLLISNIQEHILQNDKLKCYFVSIDKIYYKRRN